MHLVQEHFAVLVASLDALGLLLDVGVLFQHLLQSRPQHSIQRLATELCVGHKAPKKGHKFNSIQFNSIQFILLGPDETMRACCLASG